MASNQNANWCVTRPWFDYIMGTRVFTELSIKESNPLGIKLPKNFEIILNKTSQKIFAKSYLKITSKSALDIKSARQGISLEL
jgi:hypothetical protein